MEYKVKLGKYLRFIRVEKNHSLSYISKRTYYSKSTIFRIENGTKILTDAKAIEIAKVLDINFENNETLNNYIDYCFDTIVIKFIMFDYSWKEIFQKLTSLEKKIQRTTSYPIYVLTKYFIYSLKNENYQFVSTYTKILEKNISFFNLKQQKSFYIAKATKLFFEGNYNSAILEFEFCCESYCNDLYLDSLMYNVMTSSYSELGNLAGMQKCLSLAINSSIKTNNLKRVIGLNLIQASLYRRKRKYNEALQIDLQNLKDNIKYGIDNNTFKILNNIAVTYYWLGDYQQSANYYEKAIDLKGVADNAIYFDLAHCYYLQGKNRQARLYIEKGKKAKIAKLIYVDLLDWIEAMLNKKYSKISIKLMNRIYKEYYEKSHVQTKEFLLNLLIQQYQYLGDQDNVNYYQRILNDLIASMIIKDD